MASTDMSTIGAKPEAVAQTLTATSDPSGPEQPQHAWLAVGRSAEKADIASLAADHPPPRPR